MDAARGRTGDEGIVAQTALASVDPLGVTALAVADRVVTEEVRAARDAGTRMLREHVLEVTGRPGDFAARLACVPLGPLSLVEVEYGAGVRIRRDAAGAYAAVVVPVAGRIVTRHAGAEIVAEPYVSMAVVGEGDAIDAEWSPTARALVLRVDVAALRDAVRMLGARGDAPVHVPSVALTGASGFAVYGVIQTLVRVVDQGVMSGVLRRQLIRHAILTVALALPHSRSAELAHPLTARSGLLRAAIELVAGEQSGERTVADVARELGVSVRTLELGFRRELGTTPHEYLRETRLLRVREELQLADPAATTVSAVASRWGFTHHARFAGWYRASFGESPSTTLRS